jgi:replicative DNA helicase
MSDMQNRDAGVTEWPAPLPVEEGYDAAESGSMPPPDDWLPPAEGYDQIAADADIDPPASVTETANNDSIKQMPHSALAEESVIGSVLLNNEAFDTISDTLMADHFYNRSAAIIFAAMTDMIKRDMPVDVFTLADFLTDRNELADAGGLEYLVQVARNTPSIANVRHYSKVVFDHFTRRSLIQASGKLMDQAFNLDGMTTDELLADAENTVMAIAEHRPHVQTYFKMPEMLKGAITKLEYLHEHGEELTGITSGFEDLDAKTGGFQRSDLIIVAGRPSMGKTTVACNMVENAMLATRKPALVFSLEMPKEQLINRMMASLGRIDQTRLKNGRLEEDDWSKLTIAVNVMKDLPILINDTAGLSPMEMRSIARRAKAEHGEIGVIMVDYLQLMQMKGDRRHGNRTEEISEISRSLKALAKEMDCPVIALSQLNRSLEQRPNKRPVNSDLRESGAIEQDADLILFVYRDEVYNEDSPDKGTAELIIGKQRNGPLGTVRLAFLGQYSRFENLALEHYQGYPQD